MITEAQFTNLYQKHAQKVKRLCLGYASGDETLAQEWLQETFIKVWNHRNTFKGAAALETWMYRIAVNTCLSHLRKNKKYMFLKTADIAEPIDDTTDYKQDQIAKMFQCIDQLTPQNKALIMMELEDLPQATIATAVGLTHGTLRTRLSRIRQFLLKCITNE